MKKLMLMLLVMCLMVGSASATPLALVNGGFEAGVPAGWSSADFTGWSNATGTNAIIDATANHTEGIYSLMFDVTAGGGTAQFLQATSHVIQEGYTYTLSTDARSLVVNNLGCTQFLEAILLDDGVNPLVQVAGGAFNSGTTPVYGDDTWRTYSVSFTASAADAGKTITFYIAAQGSGTNKYGWVDNVQLDAVPEPATVSLIALGGLTLLRRKRK